MINPTIFDKMEKQIPRVERGRTELIIDHEGKELSFVHPSEGPHNYKTIGKGILARNLSIPTGYQTASLVYGIYNSQEPEFDEVKDIMTNNWLWVFNRNLWTPEGVYIVDDPEAIGINQELDQGNLESKLTDENNQGIRFSEDKTVRFSTKGTYRLGEHNKESLVKDGFVIANFGAEGAEKLAEISTEFKCSPYVFGLDIEEGKNPIQTVSALRSYWGIDRRLVVDGYYSVSDYKGGYAFGV